MRSQLNADKMDVPEAHRLESLIFYFQPLFSFADPYDPRSGKIFHFRTLMERMLKQR